MINPVGLSINRLYVGLCAAYGRERLYVRPGPVASSDDLAPAQQLRGFLTACPDIEVLDYVDAVFQVCGQLYDSDDHPAFDEVAREINQIFEQEGIGYRMTEGRLVRWDDEVIHREAISPALRALDDERFGTAGAEFNDAVTAFSRGAYRDTLTHANAAFESVLKVITGKSGTAGELVKNARSNGLIPSYLGASVENLERIMHGIPAARAQQGSAHGLGSGSVVADERLARLILTMAAGVILFFVDDHSGENAGENQ